MKTIQFSILVMMAFLSGCFSEQRIETSHQRILENENGNLNGEFCQSVESSGVTFVFDRPVKCGTFVTGAPWVSSDGEGFAITSISPDYRVVNSGGTIIHENGYMVDPAPRILVANPAEGPPFIDILRNSFDSRPGNWVNPVPLPIEIPSGITEPTSIVKAISDIPGTPNCIRYDPVTSTRIDNCIKRIVTLTVMPSSGNYSNFFRPHLYRSSKSPYADPASPNFSAPKTAFEANPNWGLFSNFAAPSFSPIEAAVDSAPCGYGEHFWFGKEDGARPFHPSDCSTYYGGGIPTGYHAYLPFPWIFLRSMFADSEPYRQQMLYSTFQYAIDLFGLVQNGYEPIISGGHHVGFKYLILLTGHILNIPEMKNVGHTFSTLSGSSQRYFGDDAVAYEKWDSSLGETIATYGSACSATAYASNILGGGPCETGAKGCEAVASSALSTTFPWFEDPSQAATDGGCVGEGTGRPHRSLRVQYLDWFNSSVAADSHAPYQDYFQFQLPYAALIWTMNLEDEFNYDPALKYMARQFYCQPWRDKRPTTTWEASPLYLTNWFLDNYVSNPYPCPIW